MNLEIVTYPLENQDFRSELAFFVTHFQSIGHETCDVMFGWAWGIDYYPNDDWVYETVFLSDLVSKIEGLEQNGLGELGYNDLFINIIDTCFHFCNDSDIHLKYSQSNQAVEFFYDRWQQLGYKPRRYAKDKTGKLVVVEGN